MDNKKVLLQVRGITKTFSGGAEPVEVLSGVDLTLYEGEMVALIGASGAGKSTLMQILGTLERPTKGEVLLLEQNLCAISDGERAQVRNQHIGFVYQFHHLLPEFTALENVMMPLLIQRMHRSQALNKAEAILQEVGLGSRLRFRPGKLSGGEQQRVAIARAVVTNPKLLLADEPTGNLDHRTAETILSLLRGIHREQNLTSLIVTHNLELAAQMDRRLFLVDGTVVQQF